jgi:hypothetical protein
MEEGIMAEELRPCCASTVAVKLSESRLGSEGISEDAGEETVDLLGKSSLLMQLLLVELFAWVMT